MSRPRYTLRSVTPRRTPSLFISSIFFVSGIPALLYQIVWQRALYGVYGVTTDSVTIIVAAFLLGLGLGAYGGGKILAKTRVSHLLLFSLAEMGIAVFGLVSLRLIDAIAERIPAANPLATGLIAFAILLLPTMLMGASLPILVDYCTRRWAHVGKSVGTLYFVNTLGSGVACFLAALFTMPKLGMSGTVHAAAALNISAAASALIIFWRERRSPVATHDFPAEQSARIPFQLAGSLAGLAGFVAIAYEIIWFRAFHFATGGSARSFSFLLGAYLAGIAFGALIARTLSIGSTNSVLRRAAVSILIANLVGFVTVPALAYLLRWFPYGYALAAVMVSAAAMGAVFPLICEVAVDPKRAGRGVSLLYVSNIAGSVLGSIAVGFVALDLWPLFRIQEFLAICGIWMAVLVYPRRAMALIATALGAVVVVSSAPLSSGLYESMLRKTEYDSRERFTDVVETRSGIVTVDAGRTIYGDGAYDGYLETDLMDSDSVLRPFALSFIHPNPEEVLMIGISGGAWSEVIANHPQVKALTLVEINPGYVDIIRRYPAVSPILSNPKVHFVIDDGRRWLRRNPERRFDAIIMDTTYHWRAHATSLLSREFFALARTHLKPGGLIYFNTTHSMEAQRTAVDSFPYAMRFGPFLAVSGSPIKLNKQRWREVLLNYKLEGNPVVDRADPDDQERLEKILSYADHFDAVPYDRWGMETAESIRRRTRGLRIITDDNMACEWTR